MSEVELYLGDNLDYLPRFTDKSIAAAIIDPPYGIGECRDRVMSRSVLTKPTDYGDFDWDQVPASPEALAHIRRVTEIQPIFGWNYFELPPTSFWLIWDKF